MWNSWCILTSLSIYKKCTTGKPARWFCLHCNESRKKVPCLKLLWCGCCRNCAKAVTNLQGLYSRWYLCFGASHRRHISCSFCDIFTFFTCCSRQYPQTWCVQKLFSSQMKGTKATYSLYMKRLNLGGSCSGWLYIFHVAIIFANQSSLLGLQLADSYIIHTYFK